MLLGRQQSYLNFENQTPLKHRLQIDLKAIYIIVEFL